MTRVTSDRVRQFVLVKDEPIDPFNPLEHVQLLNDDGTIVDPSKDQTKMTWRGDWDPAATYIWNDVVTHDNAMWIAPLELPDGAEPGVEVADPDITTVRGVMFKASDRFDSETPKTIVIGPDAEAGEQHRDNDIESGYGAVFLIDKAGLTPGLTVTITPLSATGSVSLTLATYLAGGFFKAGMTVSWTNAEVAANTPKTIAFDDGGATDDLYCHVFFQGGVDGSFSVQVNDNTNLNGPPPGIDDPEWEQIIVGEPGPEGPAGPEGPEGPVSPVGNPRRDEVLTTGSLTAATDTGDPDTREPGGGESGTWTIGPGVLLSAIELSRPARVRLYSTSGKRDADVGRDRNTDPSGDHGCLAEFLLISFLSMDNVPVDYVFSGDGGDDIYYRIDNFDLSAGTVTVTLTVKDVEI